MFAATGYVTVVYPAPVAFRDAAAADGVRVEEQLNLTLKTQGDEKEYQFTLPIGERTPAVGQIEQWQQEGKLVTVLASSVRSVGFVHDTRKDEQGNPIKRYQRPGRKVQVGDGLTVEISALITFQAYDVRLAGALNTEQEAGGAHAEFLRRQAEYRKRSVQTRIDRAKEQVEQTRAKVKAEQAEQAGAANAGGAASGDGKSRRPAA